MDIKSPFNQTVIGSVELESLESIHEKINRAHNLSETYPKGLPVEFRISVLENLIRLMREQEEGLAQLATEEGGKPYLDTKHEVKRAIQGVELAKEYIQNLHASEIPMGLNPASEKRRAYTQREPIGVVAAISAFNHPLNLIVHQVVTAFAAGCPVLVKPDMRTPLSCIRLLELLTLAGSPEGWCQLVLCENELAEKLACDPRINFLNFIGSARVGWYLRSKLPAGTRCALEHGGLAPAIVMADADLIAAVNSLAKGSFYHAGQVCVSTQRIYVHADIFETFCEAFKIKAENLIVGDPLDSKTDVGPIITQTELNRIHTWVTEAVNEGATLLCGGQIIHNTCYQPTILLNPSLQSKISTLEIFGPVVAIYSYIDIEHAITQANQTSFHFQAAVFSGNSSQSLEIANKLNASAVMINDHTAFRVDWMPFGGRDHSGLGVGGIKYTMDDLMHEKLFVIRED